MRKSELDSNLEDYIALLGHYRSQYYRVLFPSACLGQVARLRAIAQEYLDKASALEGEIRQATEQRVEIERNLFRISFIIDRIKSAKRKGTVTREQIQKIQRLADRLAANHKGNDKC